MSTRPPSDPGPADAPIVPAGGELPPPATAQGAIAVSLIVLLFGALAIVGVARSGPESRTLPLLPAGGGTALGESQSLAAPNPPEFLAPGVAAPRGEAPAYLLEGATGPEVVTALSVALGLRAGSQIESDDRRFLVVERGGDRVLRVEKAPGHPWTLQRGDPECLDRPDATVSSDGTISCPESGVGSSEAGQVGGSPGEGGTGSAPSPGEQLRCEPVDCPPGMACAQVCPEPLPVTPEPDLGLPVELPDPAAAERRSREVLNGMGLEVARTTLTASADGTGWQVLAEISVGGIPVVGMETHLVIGEDTEITSGSGMIPDVELLGSYPLIEAQAALDRLVQSLLPEPGAPRPEPALAPEVSEDPAPAGVTGIRLVLLLNRESGTTRPGDYLVPGYLMDTSDGAVFHVPAVPDAHLASPPARPAPEPAPLGPQPLSG